MNAVRDIGHCTIDIPEFPSYYKFVSGEFPSLKVDSVSVVLYVRYDSKNKSIILFYMTVFTFKAVGLRANNKLYVVPKFLFLFFFYYFQGNAYTKA